MPKYAITITDGVVHSVTEDKGEIAWLFDAAEEVADGGDAYVYELKEGGVAEIDAQLDPDHIAAQITLYANGSMERVAWEDGSFHPTPI